MRDWSAVFRAIPAALRETLPGDLHDFHWIAHSWQAKAWYGNRALHYEIWVRHRARVVEVGLHFEADELTNARLLGAFRTHASKVKRGLGSAVRIEEWDKGWSRVWEPFELGDDGVDERVGTRFVEYVRVLEPMLREELPADVEWKVSAARRTTATAALAKPIRQAAGRRTAGPSPTSSRASRSGRR